MMQELKKNIIVFVDIKIISEGNNFDHWTKKRKRKICHQLMVKSALNGKITDISLPCKVKLTRIAPRKLDYDNLCFSIKFIYDTICDLLIPGLRPGRADGDSRITVEYFQEKGKPKEFGLKIEIISI